jgi:hypothetical protein
MVSRADVLEVVEQLTSEKPVTTAAEIAEELPVTRRTVLNRLRELEAAGDIDNHDFSQRTVVWWPTTVDTAVSGLSDSRESTSGAEDRRADPGGERRETAVQSGESASKQADAAPEEIPVARDNVDTDLEVAYREYLEDRPPKKRHGKEIVVDALLLLREHEYLETGDLQERLYAEHGEHYSTERTLFNAVSRYLRDLPGFEKPDEYGGWAYAGDDEVWTAIREEGDG